jgi:hypothetical protein
MCIFYNLFLYYCNLCIIRYIIKWLIKKIESIPRIKKIEIIKFEENQKKIDYTIIIARYMYKFFIVLYLILFFYY